MDPTRNFAKVLVSGGHDHLATSVSLAAGDGARLPAPAADGHFNLIWWNNTDHADPADDPNREIVRCTARTADTLTVTRAQEGTAATAKNLVGKTYRMILTVTRKTIDDISIRSTPGGANRQIQFNRTGAFAGDADFTWDETTKRLAVAGIQGGLNIVPLATPAAPTVTVVGIAGTTRYDYRISARSHTGETLASAITSITTGNATLTAANFNRISWPAVSGARDYRVWRVHSAGTPATLGVIATIVGTTVDDTGLAGGGEAVPATDTSTRVFVRAFKNAVSCSAVIELWSSHAGIVWAGMSNIRQISTGELGLGALTFETRSTGSDVITEKMRITNDGNVGFVMTAPTHPIHHGSGAHLTAAGVWTNVSSRQLKTNFEAISVLDKLANLPIQKYAYKNFETEKDAEGKEKLDKNDQPMRKWRNKAVHADRHISPVAEDMHTIFGVGSKDGLAAIDVAGVALQGVKELLARVIELEKKAK